MSEPTPEFNESDPGWVRLDMLRSLLKIKHAQVQRIRKQLGNAHEYQRRKPGQPTFEYAPLWLRAWAAMEAPNNVGAKRCSFGTMREKYRALRERDEFLERHGKLIDVDQFCREQLYPFCDELRNAIETVGRYGYRARRMEVCRHDPNSVDHNSYL